MASRRNRSGRIHLAKPSVTVALAFDSEKDDWEKPDTWPHMKAENFDPEKHGNLKFFCPCCMEKGKRVQLKRPSKGHIQNIPFDVVNRGTKKPILDHLGNPVIDNRRYEIPPRFTLYPKQKHKCDAGDKQAFFAKAVRESGGTTINSSDNVRLVNLNIPAGQEHVDPRTRPTPDPSTGFNDISIPPKYRIHAPQNRKARKHSTGIKSVKGLAKLLDETVDQIDLRDTTLLRNGMQIIPLSHLYQDNALDLYRKLYVLQSRITDGSGINHNHTAAFLYTPSQDTRRFWTRYSNGTDDFAIIVQSRTERVRDQNGNQFNVATRIKFPNHETYDAFRIAFARAEKEDRTFLVYSEEAHVNLDECAEQQRKVGNGESKAATVYVNVTIRTPSQIMQWTPKPPAQEHQQTFDFETQPDNTPDPS